MPKLTYVRFFPGDWITGVRDLKAIERGVYISLLMEMYDRGEALTDDRRRLSERCGVALPTFDRILNKLIDLGKITSENGKFSNRKFEKLAKEFAKKSQKLSKNSQARWKKEKQKQSVGEESQMQLHPTRATNPEARSHASLEDKLLEEAASAYREAAERAGWKAIRKMTKARRSSLRKRLDDCDGLDGWKAALTRAERSSFLCGNNDRGWTAHFDFLTRESSFTKLIEGQYDDRPPQQFQAIGGETNGRAVENRGRDWNSGTGQNQPGKIARAAARVLASLDRQQGVGGRDEGAIDGEYQVVGESQLGLEGLGYDQRPAADR